MKGALFLLSYLSEVLQNGARELPDHVLQRDTTTASAAGCAFWRLERRIALQVFVCVQSLGGDCTAKLAPGAGLEPAYHAVVGYIWLTARPHTNLSTPELIDAGAAARESSVKMFGGAGWSRTSTGLLLCGGFTVR